MLDSLGVTVTLRNEGAGNLSESRSKMKCQKCKKGLAEVGYLAHLIGELWCQECLAQRFYENNVKRFEEAAK